MSYDVVKLQVHMKRLLPILWQNLEHACNAHVEKPDEAANDTYAAVVKRFMNASVLANIDSLDEDDKKTVQPPEILFSIGAELFEDIEAGIGQLTGNEKIVANAQYNALLALYVRTVDGPDFDPPPPNNASLKAA